jgi:gas vesicle protein
MRGRFGWSEVASVFIVGVGVGAALGVLFAPSSGEETREFLVDTAHDGVDRVSSKGQKWARNARETVDDVQTQLRDATETGRRAYEQAKSSPAS